MLSDTHVRAFVALLILTVASLLLTRWLLKGTTLYEAFERRRNYWLMALVITFGVENFFLGMALLGALYFWAARKDPMPVGIYLMFLLAVPPATQDIKGFGNINQLFSLNSMRMLSLAVLLPLAIRLVVSSKALGKPKNLAPRFTDIVVVALFIYILGCHTPFETQTQLMRRGFNLLLDFLLPYFVISRYLRDRASVNDALGSLFVCGLILAPIGIFEHFKGWLLYETVHLRWEEASFSIFLMRDTALRAMAGSGHALVFGHFLVVCFGLLGIYRLEFKRWRLVVVWALLSLALYSTVSRGPWLAAAVVVLAMGLFTGKVAKFYAWVSASVLVGTTALIFSPWGDKVISYLPFVGSVDNSNVDYRRLLADTTWTLIQQRPLFGSVKTLQDMEHLRQGQGIIDLVNVYADYALHYGLIGATLFVLFISSGLVYGLSLSLRSRKKDREMFFMAGNAAVALFGSAFLLVGISDFQSVPRVYTALVAILVVLARLGHQPRSRLSAIHASSGSPVALR
jgi:O-antigen ligase